MNNLNPKTRTARVATAIQFFVNGTLLATWVSNIPSIKSHLHLSDGQLGLALLGMAIGALIAFPITGYLISRFSSRTVTVIAGFAYCATLPFLALMPSLPSLSLALVVFGICNGAMDVAMNAHGAEVEALHHKSIMSSFHGMFSLGGLIGAALGGIVAANHIPSKTHFLGAALILASLLAVSISQLLPSTRSLEKPKTVFAMPSRALLGFGVIAFCAHLSEGAMADWSAVYLRDTLSAGAAFAALGYAAFSLTMTLARFGGDTLVNRVGAIQLLRYGGLIASLGLMAALLLGNPILTLVGFACVGVGMATISPIVFSAATRVPGIPSGTAIAAVATMGYSGFLIGPPFIGFLAQSMGLRIALGLVAVLAMSAKQQDLEI
jgi:MFS family permease